MSNDIKELTNDNLKRTVGGVDLGPAPDSSIVGRAQKEINKPYIWGGLGPEGYDASGFVSYCLTGSHVRIGTEATFMSWPRVSNPLPGDVCVSSNHCGIYIGENKMIHAPTFGAVVTTSSIQPNMIFVRY